VAQPCTTAVAQSCWRFRPLRKAPRPPVLAVTIRPARRKAAHWQAAWVYETQPERWLPSERVQEGASAPADAEGLPSGRCVEAMARGPSGDGGNTGSASTDQGFLAELWPSWTALAAAGVARFSVIARRPGSRLLIPSGNRTIRRCVSTWVHRLSGRTTELLFEPQWRSAGVAGLSGPGCRMWMGDVGFVPPIHRCAGGA